MRMDPKPDNSYFFKKRIGLEVKFCVNFGAGSDYENTIPMKILLTFVTIQAIYNF